MVLLIIIPIKWLSLGIYPIFRQTHMDYILCIYTFTKNGGSWYLKAGCDCLNCCNHRLLPTSANNSLIWNHGWRMDLVRSPVPSPVVWLFFHFFLLRTTSRVWRGSWIRVLQANPLVALFSTSTRAWISQMPTVRLLSWVGAGMGLGWLGHFMGGADKTWKLLEVKGWKLSSNIWRFPEMVVPPNHPFD